ncbi:DUF6115 domain-containing protein [Effusibacillus lacus]|uniref:Uncharacterized protein n=1 Tax=Effusibacillus lacus TaxID=1348429 RepID=A0A292YNS2_9BACL|nr:DUF2802 domain-containing protein [Effusibacillus lacus]TCS73148.1 uncharacterized protein DUF2802 [Effusibacillus lacus]GAX90551.1 hypothetical protein EFBL_2178 [Effusibacillus lacus]
MDLKMFLFVSLLGIAAILYAVVKGKPDAAGISRDKELETSLQAFMDELERENEYLIQTIKQLQTDLQNETAENRERIAELEARVDQLEQKSKSRKTTKKTETTPAIVFNEHYSRVVTMLREGRSPEQIAKDTGIGMGEIQMITSLIKQGDAV